MCEITFVTGNKNKAKYVAEGLGLTIKHIKLDLDEIQSLDLRKIVEHKVLQALEKIHKPVLVNDGALEFAALGRLPGPFIRFFNEEVPLETMCRMLNGLSRKAVARSTYGYFDGRELRFFEAKLEGEIAEHPAGENGWDWDKIFIPQGFAVTRAELSDEEYRRTQVDLNPFAEMKAFFGSQV